MSPWGILAVVLAIGFCFLFFYVVKLVIQLINTVKTLETTIKNLESNITPIIENFDGITGKVEDITNRADLIIGVVENKADETTQVIQKARVNLDVMRHSLFVLILQIFRYFKGLTIGIKVTSKHLASFSNIKETKGKENQKIKVVDHLQKK